MKSIAIFQHDPAQRPGFLLEFIDELSRLVLLGSLTPTDCGRSTGPILDAIHTPS
jgi:hypothetical protein